MDKTTTIDLTKDELQKLEDLKLSAYPDIKGVMTIGIGTTSINGRKVGKFDSCTKEQALAWLEARITEDYKKLESFCALHDVKLEDNQAAALLSFTYNAGWQAFLNSSMAHDLLSGKAQQVTDDLLKWNKIRVNEKLVFSQGLFNRRVKEAQCFIDKGAC